MKNKIVFFFFTTTIFAQNTGIGTDNPSTTLEIVGKADQTTIVDGIIAPKLTLVQLEEKLSYGLEQKGTIAYITDATTTTPRENIPLSLKRVTDKGYYYFDGETWGAVDAKIGSVIFDVSIGIGDGIVTSQTIVPNTKTKIELNNLKSNLGGGNWDQDNYVYSIPITGHYLVNSSIRLIDAHRSVTVFQSVNNFNSTNSIGIWGTNPEPVALRAGHKPRWTMLYTRLKYFEEGDQISLIMTAENITPIPNNEDSNIRISDASLNITLLSTN